MVLSQLAFISQFFYHCLAITNIAYQINADTTSHHEPSSGAVITKDNLQGFEEVSLDSQDLSSLMDDPLSSLQLEWDAQSGNDWYINATVVFDLYPCFSNKYAIFDGGNTDDALCSMGESADYGRGADAKSRLLYKIELHQSEGYMRVDIKILYAYDTDTLNQSTDFKEKIYAHTISINDGGDISLASRAIGNFEANNFLYLEDKGIETHLKNSFKTKTQAELVIQQSQEVGSRVFHNCYTDTREGNGVPINREGDNLLGSYVRFHCAYAYIEDRINPDEYYNLDPITYYDAHPLNEPDAFEFDLNVVRYLIMQGIPERLDSLDSVGNIYYPYGDSTFTNTEGEYWNVSINGNELRKMSNDEKNNFYTFKEESLGGLDSTIPLESTFTIN